MHLRQYRSARCFQPGPTAATRRHTKQLQLLRISAWLTPPVAEGGGSDAIPRQFVWTSVKRCVVRNFGASISTHRGLSKNCYSLAENTRWSEPAQLFQSGEALRFIFTEPGIVVQKF